MKAWSAHTARDTRTGRLFLLVELAHQMEMLDSAQLAPYLALKAMMYAMSPLCYSLHMSFVVFKCEYIHYVMCRTNILVMGGLYQEPKCYFISGFWILFWVSFLSELFTFQTEFSAADFLVWKYVQVLELWTWWWFHCDCGNSKFGVGMWQLQANKEPENSCNIYNQNYKEVYCICKRPHPDPDLPEQCEMLQCCICEDWFHEHHLGLPPSLQVLYSGFCCWEMFSKRELLCHVRVYVSAINSQWWLNLPELWKSWTIWLTCMEWWLQLAYPTAWDLWWCFGMVELILWLCCSIQKMKKGSLCMMNWCARPVYLVAPSSLSIQRLWFLPVK